jgi:hypothetical protein
MSSSEKKLLASVPETNSNDSEAQLEGFVTNLKSFVETNSKFVSKFVNTLLDKFIGMTPPLEDASSSATQKGFNKTNLTNRLVQAFRDAQKALTKQIHNSVGLHLTNDTTVETIDGKPQLMIDGPKIVSKSDYDNLPSAKAVPVKDGERDETLPVAKVTPVAIVVDITMSQLSKQFVPGEAQPLNSTAA